MTIENPQINDVDKVIAMGGAQHPLLVWSHVHGAQLLFEVPISRQALKLIQDSLRSDYLGVTFDISGVCKVAHDGAAETQQLMSGARFTVNLSVTDWIRNILEPVGAQSYFFLTVPVHSSSPNAPRLQSAVAYLERANHAFAMGHDSAVFAECYNAWDPTVFSQRAKWLAGFTDENKRAAVEDLIRVVNRFTNGGRHVPESQLSKGGFEVNHADAELVRVLVSAGLSYLAKSQPAEKITGSSIRKGRRPSTEATTA